MCQWFQKWCLQTFKVVQRLQRVLLKKGHFWAINKKAKNICFFEHFYYLNTYLVLEIRKNIGILFFLNEEELFWPIKRGGVQDRPHGQNVTKWCLSSDFYKISWVNVFLGVEKCKFYNFKIILCLKPPFQG